MTVVSVVSTTLSLIDDAKWKKLQLMRDVFLKYDHDRSGLLSKDELCHALQFLGVKDATRLVRTSDINQHKHTFNVADFFEISHEALEGTWNGHGHRRRARFRAHGPVDDAPEHGSQSGVLRDHEHEAVSVTPCSSAAHDQCDDAHAHAGERPGGGLPDVDENEFAVPPRRGSREAPGEDKGVRHAVVSGMVSGCNMGVGGGRPAPNLSHEMVLGMVESHNAKGGFMYSRAAHVSMGHSFYRKSREQVSVSWPVSLPCNTHGLLP